MTTFPVMMKRLRFMARHAVLGLIVAGNAGAADSTAQPTTEGAAEPATPPEHRRGVEQTFLTFPEWFLVFSPTEYAEFVRTHTPDEFVFWGHIRQFWQSYAHVARETRKRNDEPNVEYHVMINVIGVSTTAEYAARSAYETLIGRLTALTQGDERTPEDELATRFAQEYVDFIRVRPWYEFRFAPRLAELWRAPAFGSNMLRKWERRYALTTEYGVKAAYGWLLEAAMNASPDRPLPVTAAVLERSTGCRDLPGGQRLETAADGSELWLLPRYDPFTRAALEAAHCGSEFREIAGNRSVILVSALSPLSAPPAQGATVLFSQPILTQAATPTQLGRVRRAYVVPVGSLGSVLRAIEAGGGTVEHIFDY